MGIEIDDERNKNVNPGSIEKISSDSSRTEVYVYPQTKSW
jgi:acetate kinase